MISITIASQKGGVGKTTVALNLGFALGQRGWKTLLVGLDPQGAMGLSLTPKVSEAPGVVDYLLHNVPLSNAVIHTRIPRLSLLPIGNMKVETLPAFEEAMQRGALQSLLDEVNDEYDIVIFDAPSGFGPCTVGALWVCSYLIAPVQAEPVALRSFPQLLEWVGWLRARGARVELLGALPTMLQVQDKNSLAVAEELWDRLPEELVLEPAVPRDPAFLEATAAGVPLGLLRRNPPAVARVFDQLALQVESRLDMGSSFGEDDGPLPFVD